MSKLRKAKTGATKPPVTEEGANPEVEVENEVDDLENENENPDVENENENESEVDGDSEPDADAEEEKEADKEPEAPDAPEVTKKEKPVVDSGLTVSNPLANSGEKQVRIKPNKDFRAYIGDRFYDLKKDEEESVPFSVKQKLQKAGYLATL